MTEPVALVAVIGRDQGRDIKPLDPSDAVWEIREPGLFALSGEKRRKQVARCRSAVWRALCRPPGSAFIRTSESPLQYEVPGGWRKAQGDSWRCPAGFDPDEESTRHWLSLGNWLAYRAVEAISDHPDLFRMTPAEAIAWASRSAVLIAVESFHDDREWRVVVGAGERTDAADKGHARGKVTRD